MLKEIKIEHNPYKIGTCDFWTFSTIAKLPIENTIKIDSVCVKMPVFYNKKTVCQSMLKMEKDGYLKTESQNAIGKKIYIKFGQVVDQINENKILFDQDVEIYNDRVDGGIAFKLRKVTSNIDK